MVLADSKMLHHHRAATFQTHDHIPLRQTTVYVFHKMRLCVHCALHTHAHQSGLNCGLRFFKKKIVAQAKDHIESILLIVRWVFILRIGVLFGVSWSFDYPYHDNNEHIDKISIVFLVKYHLQQMTCHKCEQWKIIMVAQSIS